jgi:hypothetical protein
VLKLAMTDDSEVVLWWWNLGMAATALGDWKTAREVWSRYGISVPEGAGPIDMNLGLVPIRVSPAGNAEVVTVDDELQIEDWTSSFRWLCKSCSEGSPREHCGGQEDDGWREERLLGVAASSEDSVRSLLADWLREGDGTSAEVSSLPWRGSGSRPTAAGLLRRSSDGVAPRNDGPELSERAAPSCARVRPLAAANCGWSFSVQSESTARRPRRAA